jgi:SAM-dependent methyltransferase
MASDEPLRTLYPEVAAGGFSRVDGSIAFYGRVRALLAECPTPAMVVDFGAGRGAFLDDQVRARRDTRLLRGTAGRVVGIDIDEAVLTNPSVDEAYVVKVGEPLPLAGGSADLVVSDFTFEHIADPGWAAGEIGRILRPDGWMCALTPNRWGYIGNGADRNGSAHACLAALKDDGVIIWDNSDWTTLWADGLKHLEVSGFRQIEFRGLGPLVWRPWTTSVFYRPGNNCFQI